ncbi:hypothetical protein CICLE_v10017545mg [Citrus x clementina]|uniref:Uncharacterized protein n=1 Tax=Citrus clementina TaxID=85681 RepID=V4UDF5_CITCL|nr:hypothetical protein CICLE_v10017545mg [Citrus x clementina]
MKQLSYFSSSAISYPSSNHSLVRFTPSSIASISKLLFLVCIFVFHFLYAQMKLFRLLSPSSTTRLLCIT